MSTLYLDIETWNADRDISVGTYAYAETAEPLITTWAFGDGPVFVIDHTDPRHDLTLFRKATEDAVEFVAHNAMFDRAIINQHPDIYGWGTGDPARWRCTMVKAMLHGFVGGLDVLSRVFRLGEQAKIAEGKALIRRFCAPPPSNHKADRYDKTTHPEEWKRFVDYAKRDIIAMREIDRRLPNWNGEWDLWRLDQKINDRGFLVDADLVERCIEITETEKARLNERLGQITKGRVTSATQRDALKSYLKDRQGMDLSDTQRETLETILSGAWGPIADVAREVLQTIIDVNRSSTAKYVSLREGRSTDGRFRGSLQFSGAPRTRRYAGRTFQPQNLPSRGLPEGVDDWIEATKARARDFLFPHDTMAYAAAALRGTVIAPEGTHLCVADLSNIEGRIAAWLAGEEWKLEAFRAFDSGDGPDLYKVAAGRILGKQPDAVDKTERNGIGKVAELALGYQGGVGAIQNFAAGKMAALLGVVTEAAPRAVDQARENWESWGKARAGDTDHDEWIASEAVKVAWRDRHPRLVQLWYDCENAARAAIVSPGSVFSAGLLRFRSVSFGGMNYLVMRLPSQKVICYAAPEIDPEDGTIRYSGQHPITKQWSRLDTYGGKFVENACQSTARDILVQAIPKAEEAGYRVILSVHDELVTEADLSLGADGLADIMATNPRWADGLPLAAEGFQAKRYRK